MGQLSARYIRARLGRCRSGSEPVNLLKEREISVTVPLEGSQVTPIQLEAQGSVAKFQLVLVLQKGPPVVL